MSNETEENNSVQQYALAYGLHYDSEDLKQAFEQYKHILQAFPDTREAGYARSQIQHIVNATVPKQILLESQMKLATAALDQISE
jgi:predicted translin family RNA/ssDNA-binding protein